jgi:hypothetical protein
MEPGLAEKLESRRWSEQVMKSESTEMEEARLEGVETALKREKNGMKITVSAK